MVHISGQIGNSQLNFPEFRIVQEGPIKLAIVEESEAFATPSLRGLLGGATRLDTAVPLSDLRFLAQILKAVSQPPLDPRILLAILAEWSQQAELPLPPDGRSTPLNRNGLVQNVGPELIEQLPKELKQVFLDQIAAQLPGNWRRALAVLQRMDPERDAAWLQFLQGRGPEPTAVPDFPRWIAQPLNAQAIKVAWPAFVRFAEMLGELGNQPPFIPSPASLDPVLQILARVEPGRSVRLDFPAQVVRWAQHLDAALFSDWSQWLQELRDAPRLDQLPLALEHTLARPQSVHILLTAISRLENMIALTEPKLFQVFEAKFGQNPPSEWVRNWQNLDGFSQKWLTVFDRLSPAQVQTLETHLQKGNSMLIKALWQDWMPQIQKRIFAGEHSGVSRALIQQLTTTFLEPDVQPAFPVHAALRDLIPSALDWFRPHAMEGGSSQLGSPKKAWAALQNRLPGQPVEAVRHAISRLIEPLPFGRELYFVDQAHAFLAGKSAPGQPVNWLDRLILPLLGRQKLSSEWSLWQESNHPLIPANRENVQIYPQLHQRVSIRLARFEHQVAWLQFQSELAQLPQSLLQQPSTQWQVPIAFALEKGLRLLLGEQSSRQTVGPSQPGPVTLSVKEVLGWLSGLRQAPNHPLKSHLEPHRETLELLTRAIAREPRQLLEPLASLDSGLLEKVTGWMEKTAQLNQTRNLNDWPLLVVLPFEVAGKRYDLENLIWRPNPKKPGVMWVT
ncbi:MAG: hypothetical protein KDC71_18675, partial [Acidobacteria bacterium]|nr:hypothetical protein [Acidobacteriota bacterium]